MSKRIPFIVTFFFALPALAGDVPFGPNDVKSVFYIASSVDPNQVVYGIHLDSQCNPTGDEPLFPYWNEMRPPRTHGLGMLEWIPYGFSEQRVVHRTSSGGTELVRLKQLDRLITITTKREEDGRCGAHAFARIGGVDHAEIESVFVQQSGPTSVDWVDIHAKDASGNAVVERIRR
ncbi:MAG TPA: DUF4833 domain-containing protein [Polyangiaceae bacterium]|nr:DUF4833 domain-containing protein [Polyangiaceae bacterium]